MPVLFKCKCCRQDHKFKGSGWESKANFDAIPPDRSVGVKKCEQSEDEAEYTKADLRWHSDYEGDTWAELVKFHAQAVVDHKANESIPEPKERLNEIEMEQETRKHEVVGITPSNTEHLLARCRTEEQCKKFVEDKGWVEGQFYPHEGESCRIKIRTVND